MEFLNSTVHVVRKRGAVLTTFGGSGCITQAVRSRCLGRMQNWVRLAHQISQAEFPDFELLHAFWVFDVSSWKRAADGSGHIKGKMALAFQRLAKVLKLNADTLANQFMKCLPVARRHVESLGWPNRRAWAHAVRRMASSRPDEGLEAIKAVVRRYLAWGLSTSGVERSFALARDILEHRGSASVGKCCALLEVSARLPENEDTVQAVIGRSRELWSAQYGPARLKRAERIDKGQPRAVSSSAADTRAGWLRKRRCEVTEELRKQGISGPRDVTSDTSSSSSSDDSSGMSERLVKERRFQQDKTLKRKYEALEQHHLVEDEVDETLRRGATTFFRHKDQLGKRARAAMELQCKKLKPDAFKPEHLVGKHVYITRAGIDEHLRGRLVNQLEALRACLVDTIADANVMVVPDLDPKAVPVKIAWVAMLKGAYIVMPTFVCGKSTAALKYQASIVFLEGGLYH